MNWLIAGILLLGQAAPDQKRIDEAIRRGVEFLKGADSPPAYNPDDAWHVPDSDELILLTLVHGDVKQDDPAFQKYLRRALDQPLHKNYKVSLQAVALEEIDRATYQGRIAQCAQHLVDNICQNGQWGYGNPSPAQKAVPTGGRRGVSSGGVRQYGDSSGGRVKPPPNSKISISQTRFGGESGDNSNSQYAALGLRACHDANVVVPRGTIALARKWWETALQMDKEKDNKVATGTAVSVPPGGWGYRLAHNKEPYASMTAGATGALVIYDYILEKDWKKDPVVNAGLSWMAAHFSVNENTGGPSHGGNGPNAWLYYYLYALERLGVLYDTETIGGHKWYAEGAKDLLEAQKPNGSWDASHYKQPVWDTCFAILFLKKATRPLVASEDRARPK